MTATTFFNHMRTGDREHIVGYFSPMVASLLPDVSPIDFVWHYSTFKTSLSFVLKLFLSAEDQQLHKQYLWISSAGYNTHTHFDQVRG